MNITEFLLARIAEDEKRAQEATSGPWESYRFDACHSKFEMSVSVIAHENGDLICDMDGLQRATLNERYTDDGSKDAWFIANNDPDRVLAECAAKRMIVYLHSRYSEVQEETASGSIHMCTECWSVDVSPEEWWPCATIRAIAYVYRHHRDYQEKWSVSRETGGSNE